MKRQKPTMHDKEQGVALLVSVFSILFVALIISASFLFIGLTTARSIRNFDFSVKSYYVAEGGLEDLILRSAGPLDMPSAATSTLVVGTGTATRNFTTLPGGSRRFTSEGSVSGRVRKVIANQSAAQTGVQFFYGVQVGDLGLTMDSNSAITGNVYSNGDVVGAALTAEISGDVIAAGRTLTLGAMWDIQNADYPFGLSVTGAATTTVDSTGDVGSYNSLVLGSDGFARISYYDNTNDDLKFVRCLDADCATKNIATVDSTVDAGWRYTSVGLGSDGFARISYFDNTNDRLMFARCTNADCTTRNINSVDSSGNVGEFSSLVMGLDGFARIAYYAVSGGNLKFIQCTNDDCTTRNTTVVDSSGDVGKYTSITIGSDGFARIAYLNETSDDLKFVRCTNASCSTNIIATIDSAPEIEWNTSIVLGSDEFPRISYYEDSPNYDLKFVRCLDADCATKNIATVDSGSDRVGRYSSIELGSDGFARISYYDSTNGSVKFSQCTNADCTTRNITAPDTHQDAGHFTSLALGSDGFGRVSYHVESSPYDLRFIRCQSDDCGPSVARMDAAQSFTIATTSAPTTASVYIRKVGNPPDATIRIMQDESGRPGDSASDILATATLVASLVGGGYTWVDTGFSTSSVLNSGTTYWLMIDAGSDASNYWVWGGDNTDGYLNGTGKFSSNWTGGAWSNFNADLNFRIWVGGSKIERVTIGDASSGLGRAQQFIGAKIHDSNCPNSYCLIESAPEEPLPISTSTIQTWKESAESGGIIPSYTLGGNDTDSLGPIKIDGNMTLDSNAILTITGGVWVVGNVSLNSNVAIELDSSYGTLSGIVVVDGTLFIDSNVVVCGSEGYNEVTKKCNASVGSYLMLLSTNSSANPASPAIEASSNTGTAILYASNGMLTLNSNAKLREAVGRGVHMDSNAELVYESGLANALFSGGVSGGSGLRWEETF